MKTLHTHRLTLLIVLSSLCIGIQLTPRPIPNLELTSLFVFLTGALFGAFTGGMLGAVVMFINGFLSSWGFAGMMLPFQIFGMIIIGVTGGLYGRARKGKYTFDSCFEAATLGAFLTLIYDLITNSGVALSYILSNAPPIEAFISAFIYGAPFSVVHVVSNFSLFLLVFFPLTKALQEYLGGENAWRQDYLNT